MINVRLDVSILRNNLFNDIGYIRFAPTARSSRLDKKQFLTNLLWAGFCFLSSFVYRDSGLTAINGDGTGSGENGPVSARRSRDPFRLHRGNSYQTIFSFCDSP